MNLKHFYYRGYFDDIIQLAPPEKGSQNERDIEKSFRKKNSLLTSTEWENKTVVAPFSPANFEKIGASPVLKLQVQNPGLLPGIGYPHEVGYPGEFKLGFGFDHVLGLPVLPGSSVKGVLRSVFPQFKKFDAENPSHFEKDADPKKGKLQQAKATYIFEMLERLKIENLPTVAEGQEKLVHALELSIFCGWGFENLEKPARLPMHQHDVFFDALPVEFAENQLLGRDALTPHDKNPLKNPIPLPFLKVMPEVEFGFYFKLNASKIGSVEITGEQKRRIFGEILCTVGAGAKTNVGYGQFEAENASDRVPKKVKTVAAKTAQPVENQTATGSETKNIARQETPKLQFNKSLLGKKVIGEVVSDGENPVRFRLKNVEGFVGEAGANVPGSQVERFKIGLEFNLTVFESRPEKNILKIKCEDFKPRA